MTFFQKTIKFSDFDFVSFFSSKKFKKSKKIFLLKFDKNLKKK